MMIISELQKQIYNINIKNGWFKIDRPYDADIALLHSEVSEAYEDYRNNRKPTETYFEGNKPCGIPSEMADIIIRVLDTCERHSIDIETAIRQKLAYNETRGERHGGKKV